MGIFVSTTYSFGRCRRDVLKWFEILQVQWILHRSSRYAGFDCLHASGRVQLHNHKDENMAAPHKSDVVHVLSIQTTNVGVSTVAGSMYALDIFLWFIGHITKVRTFLTPETGTAMCDGPTVGSHFLLCSIRVRTCEVSFLPRLCWKQMMVARVDGWIFSHTGEDQIDIEDNVWGWVVTMIYDHDPWYWWWGHWVWHWPCATTFSMIASEIQTSFNQVSSFKPTRFLAIWSVSICDGSSNWIGYAWMGLRSTISQAPMQWLCKVPLLSDKVLDAKTQFRWGRPKGGSTKTTILCIYAILQ